MKKIILSLTLVFATVAFAAKVPTPSPEVATKHGVHHISTADAKKLYDQGVKFIDIRSNMEAAKGKVKGAVMAHYADKGGTKNKKLDWDRAKDKWKNKALPSDKSTTMIFYCNGVNCWKSYKASVVAAEKGYTGVKWMRGGMPEWLAAGYPSE